RRQGRGPGSADPAEHCPRRLLDCPGRDRGIALPQIIGLTMNTPKPRNRIRIVLLVVLVMATAGAYVYYQYFRPSLGVTAALAAAQANYNSLQNGATASQLQMAESQAQLQGLVAQLAIADLTDKAALASAQANQAVAVAQSALTTANKDLRNAQNPAGQALF